jgi:hypothetical protein
MILTGENRRESCRSVTLSTINLTLNGPGSNPGRGGERLTRNRLRHAALRLAVYVKFCLSIKIPAGY